MAANEGNYVANMFNRTLDTRNGNHDLSDNFQNDLDKTLKAYGRNKRYRMKMLQNNNFSAIVRYRNIQYHVFYNDELKLFEARKSKFENY